MKFLKQFLATVVLAFALILTYVPNQVDACGNVCRSIAINGIPGCSIQARACQCCATWPHHGCKYKVDSRDPSTGVVGNSDYHGDSHSAAVTGIYNLFMNDNGCNCHTMDSIPLGTCKLGGKACFFFSSPGAVDAKVASYRIYLHNDAAPTIEVEATAANTAAIKQTILSAFQQLAAKENLSHCTAAITSTESNATKTIDPQFEFEQTLDAIAESIIEFQTKQEYSEAMTI